MVFQRRSSRQAVRDAVRRSPGLSQRAILQQIRAEGFRISNMSGRQIVNETRIELQRAIELARRDIKRSARELGFNEFTFRESDLAGKEQRAIDRILRENIKTREVFVQERGSRTRLSNFTHVVVEYSARYAANVYIEGRLYQQDSGSQSGRITTEVSAFTEELLAERVRQQLEGIITQNTGQNLGFSASSVIDGLRVEIVRLDVNFDRLTPRGGTGTVSKPTTIVSTRVRERESSVVTL